MTGRHDYLVRVVVPDLAAYERFLKDKLTRLDGVGSIESSFALGQVKYTNVSPGLMGRDPGRSDDGRDRWRRVSIGCR